MPAHTCLVLADAARARFLDADVRLATLTEVEDLVHPASREHTSAIVTDQKGSTRGGPGAPRSGTEGPDAQRTEARVFARNVARRIAKVRGDYRRIIVAAPPRFLGMLRGELDKTTARQIETINHDLTKLPVRDIPAAVGRHL